MIKPTNPDQYQCAIAAIFSTARMLTAFDLSAILYEIGRAETLGPILEPSLWLRNGQKLAQDKELIQAAMPLWSLARKLEQPDQPQAGAEPGEERG